MLAKLIARAQKILLSPKAAWDEIDGETVDVPNLYTTWIAPLAAIPAIAGFIGGSIVGYSVFGESFRVPIGAGLAGGIVGYLIALAGVYVFALIVDFLAPNFGAERNFAQAFKVSAYFPTAAWIAGVFALIPALGVIALIGGLYSLYLLFVGLPKLMKPPAEKGTPYTIVAIIAAIVLYIVIAVVVGMAMPKNPGFGGFSDAGSRTVTASRTTSDATTDLERAAESGDLGAVLGALSGAGSGGDVLDVDSISAFTPAKLLGLPKTASESEAITAPIKATSVWARYGEGDKMLKLEITDSPAMAGALAFAGMAGTSYEREGGGSYERMTRDGKDILMESWDANSKSGQLQRSVAGRVIVSLEFENVSVEDAKRAFGTLDLAGIKRAAEAG